MPEDKIIRKLEECAGYRITKTLHFEQFKQPFEQISDAVLEDNLRNPTKALVMAEVDFWGEFRQKLKLWFKFSNTTGHKYYVEIDGIEKTIKIITGVKVRVRWQRKVGKHGKKRKN